MKIDKSVIALAKFEGKLNEAQNTLLHKESLTQAELNLFLLLRGDFDLNTQAQITDNYKLLAQYHKEKKLASKKEVPQKADSSPTSANNLTIYCDGACKGNPGESGSGLAVYEGSKTPTLLYGQYQAQGTNNTAELNALHKALLLSKNSNSSKVTIYCDSKYSIDCITKWAYSWKEKGWKKKGGEIKNLEIIQEMHTLYETLKEKVSINHVKGHAGVEGNELADRMAGLAISSQNEGYETYLFDSIEEVLDMREG